MIRHKELEKIGDTMVNDFSLSKELFAKNEISLMSKRLKSADIRKSFVEASSKKDPAAFRA